MPSQNQNYFMLTVAVSMDVNCGIYGTAILPVCVALRKALRRLWNRPLNTHGDFLFELSHKVHYLFMMQPANVCCVL